MRRWQKAALITVGIVLLLPGFVAFVLPGIVKSQAMRRVEAATGRKLVIGGISINPFAWTIDIRDFSFSERGGEAFAAFSSARIAVSPLSLYRRAPVIAAARITSPHLRIVRVGANMYNFSDLLKFLPLHPRLSVNNLTITNGSLDFIDRGLPVEKRHELRKVELALPFITTMPYYADRYITPRLSALVNGSPLHLEGKLRPFPRAVEASVNVEFKDVSLPDYLAYVPGELPVRVESGRVSAKVAISYRAAREEKPELSVNGKVAVVDLKIADRTGAPLLALASLDVAANLGLGGAEGMKLEKVSAQTRQLSVPFGRKEGITLASLSLDGGKFSREENLLEVADLILEDGNLRFSRNRKGALLPLALLHEGGKGAANGKKAATPPLRYRIGRISGSKITVVFTDEMLAERPSFPLEQITFSLEKLDGPPFAPIPFRVAGRYGEGGSLSAAGSISPTPWDLKGVVAVQRIPLTDFDSYLPENLNMVVAGGKVDARLAVSLAAREGRLTGTIGGSAGIRSLYCLDAEGEDLLKWESLQLEKMKWGVAPFTLDIGDAALTHFFSRIVVEEDGSLNLQHLNTREPKGEKKEKTAGEKRRQVRIGRVTMQDGTLAFTDHHVTGGYTTTFFNLGGRISGLTSEESRFADVDLRGNLENQSPLRITGRINPLRDDLFADLKVSFTDIKLSPLTPYSGTYLGYEVAKGQLSLDSTYRVEKRKLDSENKIFIDQLYFGKRIDSDKATALPVRRAVALLKDRNGEIRIDLPVTGRTDDPKFSVWRVVRDILKKLIVTTAKSPFALLHSMIGGQEDLSVVGFANGSAELSPGEREKLLKLATALNDRPAVQIEVVGFVDRERDDEGYRNALLLKKMRAEKFRDMVKEKKTQPGDFPETMRIAPEEYAGYLKAVYDKEEFPKPRNTLGLIKALSDAEMKKLILANTVVGEQQLRSLAEARAAEVRAFLVEQGKMNSTRVFQKSGDIYRAPEKGGGPGSRVELEVVVE
jgi:flagellar motor protein MotB